MNTMVLATAAAIAMCPAVMLAQSQTGTSSTAKMTHPTVTSSSAGDVSGPGDDVTQAMLKEQSDPNMIGTPAWWSTHATADGKPLSAVGKRSQ